MASPAAWSTARALPLAVLVLLTPAPAQAAATAQARPSAGVGTASWGVTLQGPDGRSSPGTPLLLTFPAAALSGSSQYVTAVNTGTTRLLAATYTLQSSGMNLGNIGVTACLGAVWETTNGTCAGTSVTVPTSSTGATSTAVPTGPGETLSLRVRVATVITSTLTLQFSTAVTSGPATTRHLSPATTTS